MLLEINDQLKIQKYKLFNLKKVIFNCAQFIAKLFILITPTNLSQALQTMKEQMDSDKNFDQL